MYERSRPSTSCGSLVFLAAGAGLCFLVAAIGVAGTVAGFAEDLSEPHPLDGLLVARAVIELAILGGAVAFVVSLRVSEPPAIAHIERRMARYPRLRFTLDPCQLSCHAPREELEAAGLLASTQMRVFLASMLVVASIESWLLHGSAGFLLLTAFCLGLIAVLSFLKSYLPTVARGRSRQRAPLSADPRLQ